MIEINIYLTARTDELRFNEASLAIIPTACRIYSFLSTVCNDVFLSYYDTLLKIETKYNVYFVKIRGKKTKTQVTKIC